MGILASFRPLMTSTISVKKKTTTIGADFVPVVSYVVGESHPAFVYSKTSGESFLSAGMWKSTTEYIAVIEPVTGISAEDKVVVSGREYAVDYIDDVAFQGEVMLIGLRGVK